MYSKDKLQNLIDGAMKEIEDGAKIDRLKELHIKAMEAEFSKMNIENIYIYDKNSNNELEKSILNEDKKCYSLGLEFLNQLEMVKNIGKITIKDIYECFDVTLISTQNLLLRYDLYYPNRFNYDNNITDEIIKNDYDIFILKIYNLFDNNKINEFEKNRLLLALKYLFNRNQYLLNISKKEEKNFVIRRNKKYNTLDTY